MELSEGFTDEELHAVVALARSVRSKLPREGGEDPTRANDERASGREDGVLAGDGPPGRRTLTDAMYRALTSAITEAETAPDGRVVVLRGEGDAFTAGNAHQQFAAVAMGNGPPEGVLHFIGSSAR
ncbi:MAG: hypothetical protein U0235_11165 [Polyangiaceae bacterium]